VQFAQNKHIRFVYPIFSLSLSLSQFLSAAEAVHDAVAADGGIAQLVALVNDPEPEVAAPIIGTLRNMAHIFRTLPPQK
jgi:hypothetical protein